MKPIFYKRLAIFESIIIPILFILLLQKQCSVTPIARAAEYKPQRKDSTFYIINSDNCVINVSVLDSNKHFKIIYK